MGVVKTTVGVVAGSAVTVAGLYWLFKTFFDSEGGSGFGVATLVELLSGEIG